MVAVENSLKRIGTTLDAILAEAKQNRILITTGEYLNLIILSFRT